MITLDLKGKSFGETEVLGAFRLTLVPGETLAISGPSGVGKSTLLRILAGIDRDFEGRLSTVTRPAMVFQEPVLLPWRTAIQNVTLVSGADAPAARAVLAEVGLQDLGARFPGELSLGQQRRLALARAFAADPDLLLLDEPFVSLDPELVETMLALTERLLARRRIATVLVTHTVAEAARLATRQVYLAGRPAVLRPLG